ncbi:unnamed protein product [Linum trigynum]|uniref:Uncharacterized protein n=1 Tax=Linum trigynum TaxID=586398 RepID=A0AAV2G0M2_9ROSI
MAVKDAIKAAAARFGAAIGGCFEYLWAPLILAYLAAFASFIVAFGDYFTWPKDKQTAFGRGFLGVTLALVMAHAVGTTALIVKTNRNWDDMEAHMAKWWVNATLQCFLFAHGCLLNYVVYYSRATVWTLVVVSIYAFAISQAAKFPPATWTALHSGSEPPSSIHGVHPLPGAV